MVRRSRRARSVAKASCTISILVGSGSHLFVLRLLLERSWVAAGSEQVALREANVVIVFGSSLERGDVAATNRAI